MKKAFLISVLIVAILFRPIYYVSSNLSVFFAPTYESRYQDLKKLYFSSQYVVKDNPVILPDETVEAYAAGAFVRGLNPILMIHDHPPLGKYIIGASIILFDNENAFIPLSYLLVLLGIYLVGREVMRNSIIPLFPTLMFANEPLMFIKLQFTPIPELIQLPFIIFAVYFFLKMIKKKHLLVYAMLTSVCLGGVISTRFFALGVVLLVSQITFLVLKRYWKVGAIYITTLPLAVLVLFFSYIKTVLDAGSLIIPFSTQKYILAYHSSKFTHMFTMWDLLLFNRWHTWWGTQQIAHDPNWQIFWPVSVVVSASLFVLGVFKKIKITDAELVLGIWILFYCTMLSLGYSSVRYFPPLLPFLYILSFSFLLRMKSVQNFFRFGTI